MSSNAISSARARLQELQRELQQEVSLLSPQELYDPPKEGEWSSERVAPGTTVAWEVTLPAAGIYQVWCPLVPPAPALSHKDRGMVGTLTVVGDMDAAVLPVPVVLDGYWIQPGSAATVAGQTTRFRLMNVDPNRGHDLNISGHGQMMASARVGPGETLDWDVVLSAPGTYEIFCSFGNGGHKARGMVGTLEVLPSGGLMMPSM
jgi:uncharacterized cupredoxin-like copper-binding protein